VHRFYYTGATVISTVTTSMSFLLSLHSRRWKNTSAIYYLPSKRFQQESLADAKVSVMYALMYGTQLI